MVIGRLFTKVVQSLPSWEVTKYYGRVCIYQLKCLKYRIQTSEAWFNFKCKFMPGSLRDEAECEEVVNKKFRDNSLSKKQKMQEKHCSDTLHNTYMDNDYTIKERSKSSQGNKRRQQNVNYSSEENYSIEKQRKAKRAQ